MKTFNYIIFIILITTASSYSQEKQGKQSSSEPGIQKKVENSDSTSAKFIDVDGDGINDLRQRKGMKKRNGRMDNFIDKDGDGINDNRCEGLGWSSKGKGRGKGSGRHSGNK